ncbi:MAG TPA: ATP-binding cassette domain-containing protein, partial [Tepidisphaeraceae bacterium]|nr:ATP-binding cassette domain-containing protein [Tepidisphaeraceae bacterium]
MTVSLDILDDIESPARRGRVCAIAIDRLTVRYPGDVVALREVSLEIDAGTHVVVLGASGSGKTTLLGTLSGRVPA